MDKVILYPVCTDGKGACPPEDCGGPWRYEALKKNVNNPSHEDYEEMREWLCLEEDEIYDANEFDIELTNENIRDLYGK